MRLGYCIPERTLPPSLALVRRLFLSGKFVSGNIMYLFIIFTLVVNITLYVLMDSLFPARAVSSGRYSAHATASHAQDCPTRAHRPLKGKIYGSAF